MLKKLKELRKTCLKMSHAGKDGNLQSVFSSLEILYALYNGVMNWSPQIATSSERDYLIVSKGQATMGQYVVLSDLGLFSTDELMTFCNFDSRFGMQADRTKFPEGGIENSAGSLGHGFPMAVGVAMAHKIKGKTNNVYVLAGDGEMNEGTMWEAAIFATSKKLSKLCLIIDDNESISKMLSIGSLEKKLREFGFAVANCDGHNVNEIMTNIKSLQKEAEMNQSPACLIAHTVRGYGCQTLMTDPSWFHRFPNDEELKNLTKEVDTFCENK
ncbi:MAG: hypothetical protein IK062_08590 [Selenomonadaceae bacterium]|nr:hypothetical protein [Selenomonadaceae bacterium]